MSLFSSFIVYVNTDKLRKYFSAYGTVQDAVVMKDPVSRRSRGFGFITFCDIDSVDIALQHEPHTIDSRKVCADLNLLRYYRAMNLNTFVAFIVLCFCWYTVCADMICGTNLLLSPFFKS